MDRVMIDTAITKACVLVMFSIAMLSTVVLIGHYLWLMGLWSGWAGSQGMPLRDAGFATVVTIALYGIVFIVWSNTGSLKEEG